MWMHRRAIFEYFIPLRYIRIQKSDKLYNLVFTYYTRGTALAVDEVEKAWISITFF